MNVFTHRTMPIALLAASIAAFFALAGTASALTFGDDLSADPITNSDNLSYVMAFNPDASPFAGSPISGVITKIRVRSTQDAGTETVTLLRRTTDWVSASADHTKIAEFPVTVTADLTAAGHITEVLTQQAVSAGDSLGLEHPTANAGIKIFHGFSGSPGDTCAYRTGVGDQAVGISKSFFYASCNGTWPMVQAVVEPDADGDGYGDETQDLCPTDGGRITACFIPPTPAHITVTAVKSTSKAASNASRSFIVANTGQTAASVVPFSIKSSKSVKNLRIVKGCTPDSTKRKCVIPVVGPGSSVTIKVSLSFKKAKSTTLTGSSGAASATSTVKLKRKKK